jgi:hypothetical protein
MGTPKAQTDRTQKVKGRFEQGGHELFALLSLGKVPAHLCVLSPIRIGHEKDHLHLITQTSVVPRVPCLPPGKINVNKWYSNFH